MLYLAITLLLIDLYDGVIYIGNFKAVKYNYVYFKYDFEHLSWFKNDFCYTLTCFRFRTKLINTSAKVEELLNKNILKCIYMKISRINSLVRTHMLDGAPCSVVDVNGCLSYDDDRFQQLLHLVSIPSHSSFWKWRRGKSDAPCCYT